MNFPHFTYFCVNCFTLNLLNFIYGKWQVHFYDTLYFGSLFWQMLFYPTRLYLKVCNIYYVQKELLAKAMNGCSISLWKTTKGKNIKTKSLKVAMHSTSWKCGNKQMMLLFDPQDVKWAFSSITEHTYFPSGGRIKPNFGRTWSPLFDANFGLGDNEFFNTVRMNTSKWTRKSLQSETSDDPFPMAESWGQNEITCTHTLGKCK